MSRSPCTLSGLVALALLAAGCATPGPLHVYALARATGEHPITDRLGAESLDDVPAFLEPGETVTGFAYDPYTDHFFLRLLPGGKIRVVDRPARKIKREFTIAGLGAGGDLAIRPRDGHVFLLEDNPPRIVETTRLGKRLRSFALEGVTAASGLACDPAQNQLLVLHAGAPEISLHDLEGKGLGGFRLDRPVGPALAFDAERKELYAPLPAPANAIGIFDLTGRLLRQIDAAPARFVDVGPRSFVRVF